MPSNAARICAGSIKVCRALVAHFGPAKPGGAGGDDGIIAEMLSREDSGATDLSRTGVKMTKERKFAPD